MRNRELVENGIFGDNWAQMNPILSCRPVASA
jgi:hypothetical protein